MIWHTETPILRTSPAPLFLLSNLVHEHGLKVVLTGEGADEVLAGYPWRYRVAAEGHQAGMFDQAYFGYWSRLVPPQRWSWFFQPDLLERNKDHRSFESFREVLQGVTAEHPVKTALGFEARTFLHGLLVLDDKLSMAHSLVISSSI